MPDDKRKRKRKGERPDGLIQVSLSVGYKPDGKPLRKYFYGHSRTEAEQKRDKYKAQMDAGMRYNPNITVAEWVDIYCQTYRTGENPAYKKSNDKPFNRLSERLGKMRMSDVRETDLQIALNELSGKSFSLLDKYRQTMKQVFKKARKNKIILDDPSEDLVLPKYTKGTHRALERWEVLLIANNWTCCYSGLWIMIMLFAGLRRGEMAALQWDAVDLNRRTLEVKRTAVLAQKETIIENRAKSSAGLRTIPICQPLYDALASIPVERRKGFVCLNENDMPITVYSFKNGLASFIRRTEKILNGKPADVPKSKKNRMEVTFSFRAHDLRHTFCTFLYEAGVDVKSASYLMGHSDTKITMELYTHLSKEKRENANEKLQTFFDNTKSYLLKER